MLSLFLEIWQNTHVTNSRYVLYYKMYLMIIILETKLE